MPAKTVRRLTNVILSRQARVQRVVDFLNSVEGWGWPRRMEKRDRYMDQDYPRAWLSGRKLVSRRNLLRFEEYAKRFGYVLPAEEAPAVRQDVLTTLTEAFHD